MCLTEGRPWHVQHDGRGSVLLLPRSHRRAPAGPSSALHANPLRLDEELHPLFARLAERVLVLAEVLLRQLVDVLVRALVRVVDDPPADGYVLVRLVLVD